jgi:hypothetical protein
VAAVGAERKLVIVAAAVDLIGVVLPAAVVAHGAVGVGFVAAGGINVQVGVIAGLAERAAVIRARLRAGVGGQIGFAVVERAGAVVGAGAIIEGALVGVVKC